MSALRRPSSRFAAIAFLAVACLIPLTAPTADAARRFNPDSVKGKWAGTYQSEDGTQSGSVSLTVTKVKYPRGSVLGLVGGNMKLGAAKGKLAGVYGSESRELDCATVVRRGTAASIAVAMSQDGTTLTGTYGTNTVPSGDNSTAGTVTLTRR